MRSITRGADGDGEERARLRNGVEGLPNAGETVQFRFNLPDGTSELITLTATTSATG